MASAFRETASCHRTCSRPEQNLGQPADFNTRHLLALLEGPPGCGKTHMIAVMAKIISIMEMEALYVGTSNPAKDIVASTVNKMYPGLAVLRLHWTTGELRAMRRAEADLSKQMSGGADNDPLADKASFLNRTFAFGSRLANLIGVADDDPTTHLPLTIPNTS